MKLIPLTQGKFAKVDDEDYDFLMQWKWYADKKTSQSSTSNKIEFYARRHYIVDGIKKSIYMHRQIMKPDNNCVIDHKDFDGLNNQKFNLRIADKRQNASHRNPIKNCTSKYLGVSLNTWTSRRGVVKQNWRAQLQIHKNKRKHIGYFPFTKEGEIQAAIAFDEAAKKYYGEFATLNFQSL